MIAYTRARRYELMTYRDDERSFGSFQPQPIILEPSQIVKPQGFPTWKDVKNFKPADISALIPVKTTIRGRELLGWLPKHALSQCYLKQYFGEVVELKDDKQTFYPVTFTGVKYGAYSSTHPEEELPVAALWDAGRRCDLCGGYRGDHKIQETEEASSDCAALHGTILRVSAARHLEQRSMIGVLHVLDMDAGRRYGYVAATGPTYLPPEKIQPQLKALMDACAEFAAAKGFVFVTRLVMPFLDCSGQDARKQGDPRIHVCAAPKLLSNAIHNHFRGLGPERRMRMQIFLSEKWCRTPNFGSKADPPQPTEDLTPHLDWHTIDSCNKCRGIVPAMLCHYSNPYKKSLVGRA